MSSAYGHISLPNHGQSNVGPGLPLTLKLRNGDSAILDTFRDSDVGDGMRLLNLVIEEGKSWPFEHQLDEGGFKSYFLSHNAYVMRICSSDDETVVASIFYIKPNFPGRCSHICNGGFITDPQHRNKGLGTLMGKSFLWLAKGLGYKAAYFNLVFASNTASMRLWESLGFNRLAVVPKAGRLRGSDELVDAVQYHYDLDVLNDEDNFLNTLTSL